MRATILAALLTATVLVGAAPAAHGAETAILTLSCDGKLTNMSGSDNKPEPIAHMGLVVNLTEHTVTGFAYPARIDKIDTVHVEFSGANGNWSMHGSMDRITGAVDAWTVSVHPTKPGEITQSDTWDLLCKPAKRLF